MTSEITVLINQSVKQVELGTRLVGSAGALDGTIGAFMRRLGDRAAKIGWASTEQTTGASQMGEAVACQEQATLQNVALLKERAATANSPRQQAAQLLAAVTVFRTSATARPAA